MRLGRTEQEPRELTSPCESHMIALRAAANPNKTGPSQKYAAAQKALEAAGSELAHDFLELYDKDPQLKRLAVELEAINE